MNTPSEYRLSGYPYLAENYVEFCPKYFFVNKKLYYLFLIAFIAACKQLSVWEKTVAFPEQKWSAAYQPLITLETTDTVSLYDLYVVVRHSAAFQYNNLLMNYSFASPGDTAQTIKVNLPLGENGRWTGNAFGEIIEARIKVNAHPVKLKNGNNMFVLQQLMPDTALQHILNIGVRIQKAGK